MNGVRKGDPAALILVGVLLAALVAAFFLLRDGRDDDLGPTAVGFEGLVAWLESHDIEARRFSGGGQLSAENTGLRLYPIHDDDLAASREEPETDLDYIMQNGENEQIGWIVERKMELLNTLIVLPKWRTGMRLARLAHETLLIPTDVAARVVDQIGRAADVVREEGFRTFAYQPGMLTQLEATIFAPQLLRRAEGCEPIIGTRDAMLLGKCRLGSGSFLLLSDPDLLDNHGLRYGDNAEIALALARRYAGGKPVIYDTSIRLNTVDPDAPTGEARDRSWEDLARMLEWPFTMVWAAGILLALLVLWRSWVRYGPAARPIRDGLRAAKEVSIAAKGRLLRLSGHDLKLLESWAQTRVQRLAAELLGPHRPPGDPVAQVAKAAARRNPELARDFEGAMRDIGRGERTGEVDLVRRLDRLETILERMLDEFGRSAKARR